MFAFLYHFIWTFVLIFFIPIVPWIRRKRFAERLALGLPSRPLEPGSVWIHALSVGEVVSAIPLVQALTLKYPGRNIVFTATTLRGIAIAQDALKGKVSSLLTMPIDFWWCIHRIVNHIRPGVFILVETDIWPGLIDHLKKKGVKNILVNGRISPRTFKSYQRFPAFTRMMFEPLELCLMQSSLDTERLLKIGIAPEKVRTLGNIKFDREWAPMGEEERLTWLAHLGLESEHMVWVAGSTHSGEEDVLLETFKKLHPSFPALRLILAPRKIERSKDILGRARNMGLRSVLKTELPNHKGHYDILILDTLGELGRIYGIGHVSFVGGSLEPFGGHNLLEPAGFGCPVLFGPHTHNFVLMSESLIEAGGGWRVKDQEALYKAMKKLLGNRDIRINTGRLAKAFVEENRGALGRVMESLQDFIL